MTPEQVTLVQDCMRRLTPELPALAHRFYARLFAEHPSLRALFTTEPTAQERKFSDELAAIVTAASDFGAFVERASRLGGSHQEYGVRVAHYGQVRRALLGAFAEALGEAWTPELEAAWSGAYDMLAEAMMMAPASWATSGSVSPQVSATRWSGRPEEPPRRRDGRRPPRP
jgi:nitric oxide dioxygenase